MKTDTIHNYIKGLLTLEQCENLPTPRLLAYFKEKRSLRYVHHLANQYLDDIKKLLNKREHVWK